MTSPVGHLVNAMLRETSMRHEDAVFLDDEMRERLLRSVFDAYYADAGPDSLIFDTNRMWTTKLHILARLFPEAKIIACVRSPAWVIDSIETLVRSNPFELSGIFSFEPGGTIYSRAEGLTGGSGMVGFPLSALREAVYGPHADRPADAPALRKPRRRSAGRAARDPRVHRRGDGRTRPQPY
jgi:sulfotransferase